MEGKCEVFHLICFEVHEDACGEEEDAFGGIDLWNPCGGVLEVCDEVPFALHWRHKRVPCIDDVLSDDVIEAHRAVVRQKRRCVEATSHVDDGGLRVHLEVCLYLKEDVAAA